MERLTIPLFPLHTVLFPGGPLALRIFEPRYLDMVSRSLKDDQPFGICLIEEGAETGSAAHTFDVGTLVRITYWNRRRDGLLGVTVLGERRFRIVSRQTRPDQLIMAEVELLAEDPECTMPEEYAALAELLRGILEQLDHPYRNLPRRYRDAGWVSSRLVELMPLELLQKQRLLQMDDPIERLQRLKGILDSGKFG